jgi:dephospho-CoA kinase
MSNRSATDQSHPSSSRPVLVAITGGIGAGKSSALEAFARHGAATISSDEIVHRLYRDDPEVREALIERFGTTDRTAIARIVFDDRDELAWLEGLLHPRVVRAYEQWAAEQTAKLIATEIPLLYETGGEQRFDVVVVITAPPDVRKGRRPVDDAREQRLLTDEEKARRADYVYVNDGSLEELDAFVADVIAKLDA